MNVQLFFIEANIQLHVLQVQISTQTCTLNNYSNSQRRTHPLILHPVSDTGVLTGFLIRQVGEAGDVVCGRTWTMFLGVIVVSSALGKLSWLGPLWFWDGGRLTFIWEMKKNADIT